MLKVNAATKSYTAFTGCLISMIRVGKTKTLAVLEYLIYTLLFKNRAILIGIKYYIDTLHG